MSDFSKGGVHKTDGVWWAIFQRGEYTKPMGFDGWLSKGGSTQNRWTVYSPPPLKNHPSIPINTIHMTRPRKLTAMKLLEYKIFPDCFFFSLYEMNDSSTYFLRFISLPFTIDNRNWSSTRIPAFGWCGSDVASSSVEKRSIMATRSALVQLVSKTILFCNDEHQDEKIPSKLKRNGVRKGMALTKIGSVGTLAMEPLGIVTEECWTRSLPSSDRWSIVP